MSKNYTKIEYKCQCEEGYGSTCGKTSVFILRANASTDSNTLWHKYHDGPWKLYSPSEYFSDQEADALQDVMNPKYASKFPIEDESFWAFLKEESKSLNSEIIKLRNEASSKKESALDDDVYQYQMGIQDACNKILELLKQF